MCIVLHLQSSDWRIVKKIKGPNCIVANWEKNEFDPLFKTSGCL